MTKAAGIMFVTPEGKALFLKRGPGGDMPGAWCWPGGTTEAGETAEQTATREATEELGSYPKGEVTYHVRSIAPIGGSEVDFTTFVQKVDAEFTPALNGEHTGYAWAPITEPPEPTHPGCAIAIRRITMDELGVARAMAAGELTSPQRYGNVSLFDIRITGTGVAYRNEKKDDKGNVTYPAEFVYRRPENYLTAEFLARCNGLQVIMMHPPKAVLDSKEFAARTVGAMMLPYVKGDEVWGVAKIYDDEAIGAMTANQMSTSPGVVLGGGDERFITEDGTPLLIEGKPSLLDHLAICEKGVWDKGGEPRGVRTDAQTNGENDMALSEEDMKVLDERAAKNLAATLPGLLKDSLAAARNDSVPGLDSKLDQILGGLTTLAKRVDAMEEDKKADADEEKKKADAACFGGRMDGESDEDMKKRFDASEEKVKADAMARGDSEESAKKRAADARKDAEEEDKKKADARKDADEDDKKKADSALAADNAALRATIAKMQGDIAGITKNLPRQINDSERQEFVTIQARNDEVFTAFGKKAPYPLMGETPFDYRKRLAHTLKGYSVEWKDAEILEINDSVMFDIAEKAILKDAAKAALCPPDLQTNELRPIHRTDENTGIRTTTFVGNGSFIGRMKPRTRYVSNIKVGEQRRGA